MQRTIAVTTPFSHAFNSFFIVAQMVRKSLAGAYNVIDQIDACDLQIHVGAPEATQTQFYAHGRKPVAFFSFHESPTLPPAWIETLNAVDFVIAPSTFCRDVLARNGVATPTWLVPLGLDLDDEPPLGPDRRDATFTVMWQGVHQRHVNPDGSIWDGDRKRGYLVELAFRRASIPGSRLILKSFAPNRPERDDRTGDIWTIERELTPDAIRELDSLADLFVWPTGGEGFGMIPLEKLSRGVPVAVTGWSGPLDYLKDFEGAQIDEFRFVDTTYNNVVTQMADVDIQTVVDRLRWARANLRRLRASRDSLADTARRNWNFRATMAPALLGAVAAMFERLPARGGAA